MRPITLAVLPLAALGLAACEDTGSTAGTSVSTIGPPALALFGPGWPNPGDPCYRAGESAVTGNFLDDAADLIACPPTTDAGLFTFTHNAAQVGTYEGWYLFSVPRR